MLQQLGAKRIFELTLGNELKAQTDSFNQWARGTYKAALDEYSLTGTITETKEQYSPINYLKKPVSKLDLLQSLMNWHQKNIEDYKLKARTILTEGTKG